MVESTLLSRKPVALDNLTLNLGIHLIPSKIAVIILRPKADSHSFTFSITGDTRDAGPVMKQLITKVNSDNPAFLVHVGDFVKDGEKRKYRNFLDKISALKVPLFTVVGTHELLDGGGQNYRRLFGPKNYSFTYKNTEFIVFNTANQSLDNINLSWLKNKLKKVKKVRNIFVFTYAAPIKSVRFSNLMSEYNVKISLKQLIYPLSDKPSGPRSMPIINIII